MIAKSQHFTLNSRNISEAIMNNKYSEESNSSNSRGDTGGTSPLNSPGTPLGPERPRVPASPFFPASPEGLCGPLGRDLVLQEDLRHLCIHVYPWVLEVYYFQEIPQHPLDSRVLGFQGCREFQLHNTEYIYKNQFLRLLFLELQSNSSLRTFATDISLVRTLMRTTETCFLPNQQIFTMRSLHYQMRAPIHLSFWKEINL